MFTVEMDTDDGESVTITTLDGSGRFDDVRLVLFDDIVFLSQQDDHDMLHTVIFSPRQLRDLTVAMQSTEGSYIIQEESN